MKPIYLDYAATTPVDPRVLKAMSPYWSGVFGNPGSLHSFGQKTSGAVFEARQRIAQTIGAHYSEIFFTASATEANNLAIRGAIRYFQKKNPAAKTPAGGSEDVTIQAGFLHDGGSDLLDGFRG